MRNLDLNCKDEEKLHAIIIHEVFLRVNVFLEKGEIYEYI